MDKKSNVELYQNLQRACNFDANNTYPILFQHMGYRKRIAEQLLIEYDHDKLKLLTDLYDKVNNEIKLIMGL